MTAPNGVPAGSIAVTLGAFVLALSAEPALAETNLAAKIAAAKTAADHEAIAAELEQEAKDLEARAQLHQDMATHYAMEQYAHTRKPSLKKHCEQLSADLKKAAQEAAAMAQVHRDLAHKAGQ